MKWVVVRSDRFMVTVEHPNVVYPIGRAAALPLAQQIGADTAGASSPACKYISRTQLAVVWIGDALYVVQTGKNPTFVGKDCDMLSSLSDATKPTDAESFLAAVSKEKSRLLHFRAEPTQQAVVAVAPAEVVVGLTAPHKVSVPPSRSYHIPFEANVLHFPEELGLPVFAVRAESSGTAGAELEDSTAANTSVPASVSLAVPSLAKLEDEEEEQEDVSRGGVDNTASKAQWQGILDHALLNQQQRQQQQQAQPEAPAVAAPPPAAPRKGSAKAPTAVAPLPSTEVPFGAATPRKETAVVASPAKRARSPPADNAPSTQQQQRIGFWEWKCHADGKAEDPKSWRKYSLAVAQLLEEAYKAKEVTVRIPDTLLFGAKGHDHDDDDGEAKKQKTAKCTYAVCFAEKTLDGGMIQYQLDDPTKFRVVRRKGGPEVDRRHVHAVKVIPSPHSSEEDDSSDSDDESSVSSSSSSSSYLSSSSSSSSSEDKKKRKRKQRRKD